VADAITTAPRLADGAPSFDRIRVHEETVDAANPASYRQPGKLQSQQVTLYLATMERSTN